MKRSEVIWLIGLCAGPIALFGTLDKLKKKDCHDQQGNVVACRSGSGGAGGSGGGGGSGSGSAAHASSPARGGFGAVGSGHGAGS